MISVWGKGVLMSRREHLEEMLKSDPQDEFLRYGLAMEYRKEAELDKALDLMGDLMSNAPPHVPSFLMAAQILVEQNRVTEARTVLRDGIEAAREQGNSHAAGEMGELLSQLGELGE